MSVEDAVSQVAKRYQDEGYTVTVHPHGSSVPAFASGMQLDLIASKGKENVIVEVKKNRTGVEKDPYVVRLAELVSAQPGWRFDLVVLDAETPVERSAGEGREPSVDEILSTLVRAEQMVSSGDPNIALIVTWGALEAAMRRARDELALDGRITPSELMRALYSNGVLSPAEFERLKALFSLRTQVVHGFLPVIADPNAVQDAIALAKKLLGAPISPPPQ